jgi:hypothetical protein
MRRRSSLLGWAVLVGSISACSIYGPDLTGTGGSATTSSVTTSSSSSASSSGVVGGGGSGGSTTSSASSSSSGGTGGSPACTAPADCPGVDTECHTRTCVGGVCGADDKPSGTALAAQTSGDCKIAVCDGNGGTSAIPDNNDKKDDNNVCTTDGCSAGSPTHTPVTPGTACTGPNGAKVCGPSGVCVECVSGTNCATGVCVANTCIAAQCNDGVKNGSETDKDCGGTCPPCAFNKVCGSNSDCIGQSCVGGVCVATCTDTVKNGSETDVDCGGAACATKCASGKSCNVGADCANGNCLGGKCVDQLLISEVQTRGDAGGNDDFIEIYNPNAVSVTFDATWEVWTRNAASQACAALNKRITGANQVIPAHGHLLFVNSAAYNGAVAGDGTYTGGFTDSGQIVLLRGGALVDSLCYYFNTTTQNNLTCATPPAMWFVCQGEVSNSPHNDTTGGMSNTDVSMERKPGGAAGNGQSTGDNGNDFTGNVTSSPQNVMSPVTP